MTLFIGQLHPITVYMTVFECVLFWCWVSLCFHFTNSLRKFYFTMIIVDIYTHTHIYIYIFIYIYIIGFLWPLSLFWITPLIFLKLSSSSSANTHLPGCFRPWTFLLNIGLNMLPSEYFTSCLDFLLRYSTEEFRALHLIVLVMFGTMD